MPDDLPLALPGDQLQPEDLQAATATLRQMATDMDGLMTDALSVPELREIGRVQAHLRDQAAALIARRIDLLAGEASVTAEQITLAVNYSQQVIQQAHDTRVRLERLAALAGFVGAVVTGNGKLIVQAAGSLKTALG